MKIELENMAGKKGMVQHQLISFNFVLFYFQAESTKSKESSSESRKFRI